LHREEPKTTSSRCKSSCSDFGLGAEEVTGRHRKSICKKVGKAQGENNPGRKPGAGYAINNCECRDGAIDATIDPVAQIILRWTGSQGFFDRFSGIWVSSFLAPSDM